MKEDYNIIKTLALTGTVLEADQSRKWRKSNLKKIPPYLSFIVQGWNSLSPWDIVIILSFLRFYKLVYFPRIPIDLSTITTPMREEVTKTSELVIKDIKRLWEKLGMPALASFHWSLIKAPWSQVIKSSQLTGSLWLQRGPNGRGLMARIMDLFRYFWRDYASVNQYIWAVFKSMSYIFLITLKKRSVLDPYKELLGKEVDWEKVKESVSGDVPLYDPDIFVPPKSLNDPLNPLLDSTFIQFSEPNKLWRKGKARVRKYAKLVAILGNAGKYRYIAMGTWILQSFLYPLHQLMFGYLRSLSEDATFHQGKIHEWVRKNTLNEIKMYSYDLTAATDRLPLSVQGAVLERWLLSYRIEGPLTRPLSRYDKHLSSIAKCWTRAMSKISFDFNGKRIAYAVGQGMGLYTSWSSLALTHHILVRLAAAQVGVKGFRNYLVLGDDVVIGGTAVAKQYLILIESLGIQVSISKSVIPGEIKNGAEFASRLILGDINLSPLPLGLLIEGTTYRKFSLYEQVMVRYCDLHNVLVHDSSFLESLTHAIFGKHEKERLRSVALFLALHRKWCRGERELTSFLSEAPGNRKINLGDFFPEVKTLLEVIPLSAFYSLDQRIKLQVTNRLITALKRVNKWVDGSALADLIRETSYFNSKGTNALLKNTYSLDIFGNPWKLLKTIRTEASLELSTSSLTGPGITALLDLINPPEENQGIHESKGKNDTVFPSVIMRAMEEFTLLSWGPARFFLKGTTNPKDRLRKSKTVKRKEWGVRIAFSCSYGLYPGKLRKRNKREV